MSDKSIYSILGTLCSIISLFAVVFLMDGSAAQGYLAMVLVKVGFDVSYLKDAINKK
jgi:hypothetical protein